MHRQHETGERDPQAVYCAPEALYWGAVFEECSGVISYLIVSYNVFMQTFGICFLRTIKTASWMSHGLKIVTKFIGDYEVNCAGSFIIISFSFLILVFRDRLFL